MCLCGSAPTSTEGRALPIESSAAFPSSPWVFLTGLPCELLPRPTVAEIIKAAELTPPGNGAPVPHSQEKFPGHNCAPRTQCLINLFITATELNTNNIPVPVTSQMLQRHRAIAKQGLLKSQQFYSAPSLWLSMSPKLSTA